MVVARINHFGPGGWGESVSGFGDFNIRTETTLGERPGTTAPRRTELKPSRDLDWQLSQEHHRAAHDRTKYVFFFFFSLSLSFFFSSSFFFESLSLSLSLSRSSHIPFFLFIYVPIYLFNPSNLSILPYRPNSV